KYEATLPPCFCPPTILKVATFWKEETKYSLRYLPTSLFARAFTRSASALFQVKRGSSKWPETCRTKTSFCCFFASSAASLGVSTTSRAVPWQASSSFLDLSPGGAAASGPPATARQSTAAFQNFRDRMRYLLCARVADDRPICMLSS